MHDQRLTSWTRQLRLENTKHVNIIDLIKSRIISLGFRLLLRDPLCGLPQPISCRDPSYVEKCGKGKGGRMISVSLHNGKSRSVTVSHVTNLKNNVYTQTFEELSLS